MFTSAPEGKITFISFCMKWPWRSTAWWSRILASDVDGRASVRPFGSNFSSEVQALQQKQRLILWHPESTVCSRCCLVGFMALGHFYWRVPGGRERLAINSWTDANIVHSPGKQKKNTNSFSRRQRRKKKKVWNTLMIIFVQYLVSI